MVERKTKKKMTKSKAKTTQTTVKVTDQNTSKTTELKVPTFISVESTIGAISILAMKSSTHKHLFLADYEWLILPAISTKQFILFRGQQNEPIAFVSWASVSAQVEKRLTNKNSKLQPADWKSGDTIYVIDIISPFGSAKELLKKLYDKQFKDKDVYILRPKDNGKGIEKKLLKDVIDK